MMKHWILLILFLFPTTIFSQIRGIVVDKKTGKPIEYSNIWVENQNIGTTSDNDGKFFFKENIIDKTLIISAIGFESQGVLVDSDNLKIELNPKSYEIREVVVYPKKKTEITIDAYNKSYIKKYFSCIIYPWIVAKYFKFSPTYLQTPYLKKLKILTRCEIKESSFNLRLMFADEKGEPSNDILNKNLIITASKGKRNTIVDLTEYHISFPKDGFFIAIEWLIIESNKTDFVFTTNDSEKRKTVISYEPSFGLIINEDIIENWIFSNGKWGKANLLVDYQSGKSMDFAIELTLSD
ncbi:MAG: carboxypeptidase-like regulatory domain-containing protein [Tenuifilaceae bacterium]